MAFFTNEYANNTELMKIKAALGAVVLGFFALGGSRFFTEIPLIKKLVENKDEEK